MTAPADHSPEYRPGTAQQQVAVDHIALIAEECAHPRFGRSTPLGTIVLTVNAGYE